MYFAWDSINGGVINISYTPKESCHYIILCISDNDKYIAGTLEANENVITLNNKSLSMATGYTYCNKSITAKATFSDTGSYGNGYVYILTDE